MSILPVSATYSQADLSSSEQSPVFCQRVSHSLQAKHRCCWLSTGIAHRSSHFPPSFPAQLRKQQPWEVLHRFRGLHRLPGPTLQMPEEVLRNGPQHQPRPRPSLPALLSTASTVPLPFCSSFISTHYCLCLEDVHYFSYLVIDGPSTVLYGSL